MLLHCYLHIAHCLHNDYNNTDHFTFFTISSTVQGNYIVCILSKTETRNSMHFLLIEIIIIIIFRRNRDFFHFGKTLRTNYKYVHRTYFVVNANTHHFFNSVQCSVLCVHGQWLSYKFKLIGKKKPERIQNCQKNFGPGEKKRNKTSIQFIQIEKLKLEGKIKEFRNE